MAAHKGCAKTGGRAKGTPNKLTSDIKDLARIHGPAAIERLAELAFGDPVPESAAVNQLRDMVAEGAKPSEIAKFARAAFAGRSEGTCVAAIKEILDRGYGKSLQPQVNAVPATVESPPAKIAETLELLRNRLGPAQITYERQRETTQN